MWYLSGMWPTRRLTLYAMLISVVIVMCIPLTTLSAPKGKPSKTQEPQVSVEKKNHCLRMANEAKKIAQGRDRGVSKSEYLGVLRAFKIYHVHSKHDEHMAWFFERMIDTTYSERQMTPDMIGWKFYDECFQVMRLETVLEKYK